MRPPAALALALAPALARALALALTLALLAPTPRLHADPPPDEDGERLVRRVAALVLAASGEGGLPPHAPTLAALSALEEPDPWLVAEALVADGQRAAAHALAAVAHAPDVAALRDALAADPSTLTQGLASIRAAVARGERFEEIGRAADALAAYAEAGEAAERLGWLAVAGDTLLHAGVLAYRAGRVKEAASHWQRSADVFARRDATEAEADTLGNVAVAHETLGDLDAALAAMVRVVALRRRLGDDDPLAAALLRTGSLLADTGHLGKAAAAYEEALPRLHAARDPTAVARAQSALGAIHLRRGDRHRAVAALTAALADPAALDDPTIEGATLRHLGRAKGALGDAGAPALLAQALDVARRSKDGVSTTLAHLDLGVFAMERGDLVGAGGALRAAEEAATAAGFVRGRGHATAYLGALSARLGDLPKAVSLLQAARALLEPTGDRAALATTLGALSDALRRLGEFGKAEDALRRARALAEAVGDRTLLAAVHTHAANLLLSRGEPERALAEHLAAREAAEAAGAVEAAANASVNLGAVFTDLDDLEGAADALEHARERLEALGLHATLARALLNLADVRLRAGRSDEAMPLLERARTLCDQGKDRAGATAAWLSLGEAHRRAGRWKEALAALDRASRDAERLQDDDLLVRALAATAAARLARGDAALALEIAKRAVPAVERLVRGEAESHVAGVRARYGALYDVGVRAAAHADDPAWLAYFLESGRAGALLSALGGREALLALGLPDDLREADGAARAAEATAARAHTEALEADDLPAQRARRAALEAARDASADVAARIQREQAALAGVAHPRAATLEELQGALAPDEALVLYGWTAPDVVALVVTPDEARVVRLGPVAELDAACERLALSEPAEDPAPALDALRARVAGSLGLASKVKRLLLSPDGPLTFVPGTLLFPDRVTLLVPSGTTLLALRAEQAPRGTGVLAVGDPIVPRLPRLPGSRAEATEVGDPALLGEAATQARLLAALGERPRWRALHVACHGLIDARRPSASALALTADDGDDGLFTAREVFGSRIPADLAVLSACETGRGRLVRGEGLLGLTRAFMFAGAPRVIVSLWKVDDEATAALMKAFYGLYAPKDGGEGVTAAAALQRAQAAVAADPRWRHPYYWAAWVLWGLP